MKVRRRSALRPDAELNRPSRRSLCLLLELTAPCKYIFLLVLKSALQKLFTRVARWANSERAVLGPKRVADIVIASSTLDEPSEFGKSTYIGWYSCERVI